MSGIAWLVTKHHNEEEDAGYDIQSRVGLGMTWEDLSNTWASIFPRVDVTEGLRREELLEQATAVAKWRVKDDDGELYYEGLMDIACFDGEEDEVFAPLTWATADAGAVTIEVVDPRLEDPAWVQL